MATYVPNTKAQQQAMLDEIGKTKDDLLAPIPHNVRLNRPLALPDGKSEFEALALMKAYANQNKVFKTILLGAGSYHHYIPSVVKHVSAREEFVTAYTPYQSEFSQGILQSIFEYQTIIANLTGMDAANASVYDGATAVAEAINMCIDKKQPIAFVSDAIHPQTKETIKAYTRYLPIEVIYVPTVDGRMDLDWLKQHLDDQVACVVMQQPNYYGILEDAVAIGQIVNASQAKFIASVNPMTLSVLAEPRAYGADIAVGEAQPFGLAIAYGGPYLGFMATTQKHLRKLPGRIVGQTEDIEGKRAFALTLQAREQHIRREKATSSICSNQAHCALTAAIYVGAMGPEGLKEVANTSYANAHYFASQLQKIGYKLTYNQPFFFEFVTTTPINTNIISKHLQKHDVLSGLALDDNHMLWCVTEVVSKETLDQVITFLKEANS